MSRKGESFTLSLSVEVQERLKSLALEHKQMWGNEPNISALMRAIASGKLRIIPAEKLKEISEAITALFPLIE